MIPWRVVLQGGVYRPNPKHAPFLGDRYYSRFPINGGWRICPVARALSKLPLNNLDANSARKTNMRKHQVLGTGWHCQIPSTPALLVPEEGRRRTKGRSIDSLHKPARDSHAMENYPVWDM